MPPDDTMLPGDYEINDGDNSYYPENNTDDDDNHDDHGEGISDEDDGATGRSEVDDNKGSY